MVFKPKKYKKRQILIEKYVLLKKNWSLQNIVKNIKKKNNNNKKRWKPISIDDNIHYSCRSNLVVMRTADNP